MLVTTDLNNLRLQLMQIDCSSSVRIRPSFFLTSFLLITFSLVSFIGFSKENIMSKNLEYSTVISTTTVEDISFGTQTIPTQFYALNKAVPQEEVFFFGFPTAMGGSGKKSYTISPIPTGMTFDGNVIVGTPTVAGTTTHVYRATDESGNMAELSFQITIREFTPLTFGAQTPTDKVFIINEPFDFILPEAMGGHGNLVYRIVGEDESTEFLCGSTIGIYEISGSGVLFDNRTRRLYGTSTRGGIINLQYVVSDCRDPNIAKTILPFTVRSTSLPIITSNGGGDTGAITVEENKGVGSGPDERVALVQVNLTLHADQFSVYYEITGGTDENKFIISSSGIGGTLEFKTAPNFEKPTDVGGDNTYEVEVSAIDRLIPAAPDTQTLTITVTNVNDAPIITGTPATTVSGDTPYLFTPTGADDDDPTGSGFTYGITNRPSWAEFEPTTGALSGTPTNERIGNYENIVIC